MLLDRNVEYLARPMYINETDHNKAMDLLMHQHRSNNFAVLIKSSIIVDK